MSEGFELIGAAAGLDESVTKIANPVAITRDMLQRLGWPEEWINDEKKVAAAVAALNERKQAEEMAATGAMGEVYEVSSPDDNLQAVFEYLVK